jgi:hypothetical protein
MTNFIENPKDIYEPRISKVIGQKVISVENRGQDFYLVTFDNGESFIVRESEALPGEDQIPW